MAFELYSVNTVSRIVIVVVVVVVVVVGKFNFAFTVSACVYKYACAW